MNARARSVVSVAVVCIREVVDDDCHPVEGFPGEVGDLGAFEGIADRTPTNDSQLCAYVIQYATVKAAWGLVISQADFDAVQDTLTSCDSLATADALAGSTPVPSVEPTSTTITPSTTTSGCHPAYSPCLPFQSGNAYNCGDLPSSLKPVTVLTIGNDPYELDGDNNGIGCEGG